MKKQILTTIILMGLVSLAACNKESPREITTSVSDEPSEEILHKHKVKPDNKLTENAAKKIETAKQSVKSTRAAAKSEPITAEAPAIESSEEAATEAPVIESSEEAATEAPVEQLPEQTYPAEQQPVTQEPPTEQATDIPVTEEVAAPEATDSAEITPTETTEPVQ
ncbi:hypothetical protein [Macrococcoides caseolyticum]|uniref:Internalin n=1 Tax=Macrococcoides caseolyticum TaxID=69966 RepID=A0A855GJZ1_9STAP|nr:hypothetical protein [Macrococcus caseolyticus]PKD98075.1 hypothetical protein CW719_09045 [Macrococcus caseolyticus]PKE21226.1 hypothetical protein CW688_08255 [Macrococcus caseolyticus]PKE26239.1 hypothetical protein CW686_06105 [Macrococcus caseolyticus]PKE58753.1 hypothetical protein CW673_06225 [Macrococcus caseolyticus]PKE60224.1 hypothetical protein CW669_09590 [Macrococcus caseolyticus]